MDQKRPRGREKNVSGPGASVNKRGEGLHTGPVGGGGGYEDRKQQQSGNTGGKRSGGMKLIILLLAVLLGGGGGLGALLGGQDSGLPQQGVQSSQTGGTDLTSVLSGLGGGSVSAGWQSGANTGKLNTNVAAGAREKRTKLLGNGQDTATIMVYMCGTDLESRSGMGTSDLQEMLGAEFGSNINLLVYTGGCKGWKNNLVSSTTNQIWQIKSGGMVCVQDNLGSTPMTDPNVLAGYIQWCAKNYPASRYELIFWDHGGGSITGYGYDEKFASSGSMGLAGINAALKNAGVTFDFIGFDACLMATAETAMMLTPYADYLIASEETEPGVGWYYTNWLTAFGQNPSMPTIELGQKIVDDFVDVCAQKCRGQMTTLSVIDLAELEKTLPEKLTAFSKSAGQMIQNKEYQAVSNARANTREFAQSSKIDQIDLVHLARNLGTAEGNNLAETLLSAVKYNRTSSNMTNAYGISIYFPYRNVATVSKAAASYEQIGMDEEYTKCIKQFASLEVSGQAASGGTASPLPSLLGMLGGGTGGDTEAISQLLGAFLGGDFGRIAGLNEENTDFLTEKAMSQEDEIQYLSEHCFDLSALVWIDNGSGTPVLKLREEQWELVQALDLNVFYDDGEGYIDMGLDNIYDFDSGGNLLGVNDGTWLAINGQPVAYYHTSTVDDGENYTINGYVPVLHNGQRAELLLVFDNANPYGFVSGVRAVYAEGETDTVAKNDTGLQPGDTLEFLCDYYSYDGSYQDSYLTGEPVTVTDTALTVSNVPLEGGVLNATYRFTDIYNQHWWTPAIP
ncbi:MAG: peptidase C11 [Oscillospiraceae bacterium]|nr:peptidase C11 [Oscillospiraceae bacterium]